MSLKYKIIFVSLVFKTSSKVSCHNLNMNVLTFVIVKVVTWAKNQISMYKPIVNKNCSEYKTINLLFICIKVANCTYKDCTSGNIGNISVVIAICMLQFITQMILPSFKKRNYFLGRLTSWDIDKPSVGTIGHMLDSQCPCKSHLMGTWYWWILAR